MQTIKLFVHSRRYQSPFSTSIQGESLEKCFKIRNRIYYVITYVWHHFGSSLTYLKFKRIELILLYQKLCSIKEGRHTEPYYFYHYSKFRRRRKIFFYSVTNSTDQHWINTQLLLILMPYTLIRQIIRFWELSRK